jgi:hypothetical protein
MHATLLGMMAERPAGETMTLREMQVGIGRGKAKKTVKRLTEDDDSASGAEEAGLLEEGDSVVLMRGHDWR